jgi:hypothetical protein
MSMQASIICLSEKIERLLLLFCGKLWFTTIDGVLEQRRNILLAKSKSVIADIAIFVVPKLLVRTRTKGPKLICCL